MIMVMVMSEYSRRRERATGVAYLVIVFPSVDNVVLGAVSCTSNDVGWLLSLYVVCPVSVSWSTPDDSRLVYSIFSGVLNLESHQLPLEWNSFQERSCSTVFGRCSV